MTISSGNNGSLYDSTNNCDNVCKVASGANPHANTYNIGHQMTKFHQQDMRMPLWSILEIVWYSCTTYSNTWAALLKHVLMLKVTLEFSRLMETIANFNLLGNFQTSICSLDVSPSTPNRPSSPLMLRPRTGTPQPQEAVTQFTARNNKGIIPLIDPITPSMNTQVLRLCPSAPSAVALPVFIVITYHWPLGQCFTWHFRKVIVLLFILLIVLSLHYCLYFNNKDLSI